MRLLSLCSLIGSLILAGLLGYVVGRIVSIRTLSPDLPIVLQERVRPSIPVVRLEGVRGGFLQGYASGAVRFLVGNEVVVPDGSGSFVLPTSSFFTNTAMVDVPVWARFVASKRGWRYYPVLSSEGEALSPKHRVYFRTSEEAEQAGYKRWKE